MYVRIYEQMREQRYQRLGQAPAAAPGPVKDFICIDGDLRKLNRLLKRAALYQRHIEATRRRHSFRSRHLDTDRSKRTERCKPNPSNQPVFKEAFGKTPDDTSLSMWLPSGKSWVEIVSKRLQRAGEILAGGNIEYRCGSPQICPLCKRALGAPYGCSEHGQYYICLGLDFWKAWDIEPETQTSTLMHEALHIYFNIIEHADRLNNANRYVRFVRRCNEITISTHLNNTCSPAPP